MAALFTKASTQRLTSSPAIVTAAPLTIGCWLNMTAASADECIWSLDDTSGSGDHYELWRLAGNTLAHYTNNDEIALAPTVSINTWIFTIFRAVAAANRWTSAWYPTGVFTHGQRTSSITPGGLDTLTLGYSQVFASPMGGKLADFWITNSDIQPGGAQLDNALMKQLALHGPLSVPHVRNALVEYLPLKDSVLGDKGDYYSSRGRRAWTNVNGVRLAA